MAVCIKVGKSGIRSVCRFGIDVESRERSITELSRTVVTSWQRNPLRITASRGGTPRCRSTLRGMSGKRSRERQVLDDVSKAIINQLQQDGRRSYAAIGKVVGLSEAAVRQRVQRLTDGGVIQVVAVTDPMELGFARQAMVGVRVTGAIEPVADAIAALDEVDYVVVTAGSYDVLAEVVAESDEHLLEIISDRIRSIDGVLSTETFMYLHLRKQTYSWGVR